jgi:hypothetical protein
MAGILNRYSPLKIRFTCERLADTCASDFAFAIVIGVFFQYFSIAPMAGQYGPKTLYRALKADFLSLLFFEVGLFGWMAIFQIAIFQWKLEMDSVTYWWMMQVRTLKCKIIH